MSQCGIESGSDGQEEQEKAEDQNEGRAVESFTM